MTPLLIDYGLDVSNPYDINAVSSVNKLTERLRRMRPSIVLYNLLGVDKKNMKQVLHDISKELHEYIRDTGFILVVLDSMSLPALTKKEQAQDQGAQECRGTHLPSRWGLESLL